MEEDLSFKEYYIKDVDEELNGISTKEKRINKNTKKENNNNKVQSIDLDKNEQNKIVKKEKVNKDLVFPKSLSDCSV